MTTEYYTIENNRNKTLVHTHSLILPVILLLVAAIGIHKIYCSYLGMNIFTMFDEMDENINNRKIKYESQSNAMFTLYVIKIACSEFLYLILKLSMPIILFLFILYVIHVIQEIGFFNLFVKDQKILVKSKFFGITQEQEINHNKCICLIHIFIFSFLFIIGLKTLYELITHEAIEHIQICEITNDNITYKNMKIKYFKYFTIISVINKYGKTIKLCYFKKFDCYIDVIKHIQTNNSYVFSENKLTYAKSYKNSKIFCLNKHKEDQIKFNDIVKVNTFELKDLPNCINTSYIICTENEDKFISDIEITLNEKKYIPEQLELNSAEKKLKNLIKENKIECIGAFRLSAIQLNLIMRYRLPYKTVNNNFNMQEYYDKLNEFINSINPIILSVLNILFYILIFNFFYEELALKY